MKIIYLTLFFTLLAVSCSLDNESDNLDISYMSSKDVGTFKDTTIQSDSISDLNYNPVKLSLGLYSTLWLGKSGSETYSSKMLYTVNKTQDSVIDMRIALYTDSTFLPFLRDTLYTTISFDTNEILAPLIYVEDTSISSINTSSFIDRKPFVFKVMYKLPTEIYSYFKNSSDTLETGSFMMTINGTNIDTLIGFYSANVPSIEKSVRPHIEIVSNKLDTLDSLGNVIVSKIAVNELYPSMSYSSYTSLNNNPQGIYVGSKRLNSFYFYAHSDYFLLNNFIKNIYLEFYYKETNNKFYADTTYDNIFELKYYGNNIIKSSNITEADVRDSVLSNGDSVVFVSKDITLWGIDMLKEGDSLKLSPNLNLPYLFNAEIFDFKIRVEESIYKESGDSL